MDRDTIKIKDLIPDTHNANKGTERGRAMLEASLEQNGAGRSILIDKHGNVIAGNKTLEAAQKVGLEELEVIKTDGKTIVAVQREDLDLLKDPEARKLAYDDNRAGEINLDWDVDQLAEDLKLPEIGLDTLWIGEELGELFAANGKAGVAEDPGAHIDRAGELRDKWGTERGQLWQVGRHRLLCGDSTSREDVERLMDGEKAEMVWTDPPYGVRVGDKNKYLNSIGQRRLGENLVNDERSEAGLLVMLEMSFDLAISVVVPGGAWYVSSPAGPLLALFGQVLKERGIWRQTIQWIKNNATFSPMGVDYHWQAEPVLYGWLPNAGHRFYGGRKQTTVWEIDRPLKSPEHPTMKPVELVLRALENSSKGEEVIYDPFCGSGTTMVAAEQLGRTCYAMEIEPKYVAVALERLSEMGVEGHLVAQTDTI